MQDDRARPGEIRPGDKLYIIAHAYWHYLAEVVEVGPRGLYCRNIRQIHSCKRGWTEFFRDGAKKDTTYFVFPDGWLPIGLMPGPFRWEHPIPEEI